MDPAPLNSVTFWLKRWHDGSETALQELTGLLYDDLRRLAAHYLRAERADHTLQPTAVVHELYLRMERLREIEWQSRAHFINVAAQAMRRILVDHARKRQAAKRAAGELTSSEPFSLPDLDLVALDISLDRLAADYPRPAHVVELHFFGGLGFSEVAEVLGSSLSTVERDWRFARAWLQDSLAPPSASTPAER